MFNIIFYMYSIILYVLSKIIISIIINVKNIKFAP